MQGTYDLWLVGLSIAIAVVASYVALDLASRVSVTRGTRAARYWLVGGAFSMGTGIWSMHFIGMLAFRMPMPMAYDTALTFASLLIAVIVSAFALWTVSQCGLGGDRLLRAGISMGLGISAMHYTGMEAMEIEPSIAYDPTLVVLSIAIAIAASLAALWIAFALRSVTPRSAVRKKTVSSLLLGAAIAGMHYTGMAAAGFAPGIYLSDDLTNIGNAWLPQPSERSQSSCWRQPSSRRSSTPGLPTARRGSPRRCARRTSTCSGEAKSSPAPTSCFGRKLRSEPGPRSPWSKAKSATAFSPRCLRTGPGNRTPSSGSSACRRRCPTIAGFHTRITSARPAGNYPTPSRSIRPGTSTGRGCRHTRSFAICWSSASITTARRATRR